MPLSGEAFLALLARSERAPVVAVDERAIVLDLSGETWLGRDVLGGMSVEAWGAAVEERMRAAGTGFAFGRWAEPRCIYGLPSFAGPVDRPASAEARTVHLGLDVFCAAATPVASPLSGRVSLVAHNAAEFDYGPLVILEHELAGQRFYTLHGHLGSEVLTGLAAGQPIAAGQRFASVGGMSVNGHWPPHLHVQIILDLQGLGADFPGVCRPSEQARWLALSPSPAALFPEIEPGRLVYARR